MVKFLHRRHCVVVLEQDTFSLVLQPRKAPPCLTERLLMGRKESNQTKTKSVVKSSSLLTGNFCRLLKTIAKSLDPDQDRHDTLIVFLKEIFEKVNFEKSQQKTKLPSMQKVQRVAILIHCLLL